DSKRVGIAKHSMQGGQSREGMPKDDLLIRIHPVVRRYKRLQFLLQYAKESVCTAVFDVICHRRQRQRQIKRAAPAYLSSIVCRIANAYHDGRRHLAASMQPSRHCDSSAKILIAVEYVKHRIGHRGISFLRRTHHQAVDLAVNAGHNVILSSASYDQWRAILRSSAHT